MRKLVEMAWNKRGDLKSILAMTVKLILTIVVISISSYIIYKLMNALPGGG